MKNKFYLKYFLLLFFTMISSCKIFKKKEAFITENDKIMVCNDTTKNRYYRTKIDTLKQRLSNNVFPYIDINGKSKYASIFDDSEHYHDVDIKARIIIDSLIKRKTDTIVFYRHWLHTNGFNGYGKLLWKKNNVVNELLIVYNDSIPETIKAVEEKISKNDIALNFYLANDINNNKCTPGITKFIISHGSSHFVYSKINNKENSYTMSGPEVLYFKDNTKTQFIELLIDNKKRD